MRQTKMGKKSKIILIIAMPVLILLIVLYMALSSLYVPKQVPLVYPESGLSESLFVSQNNEYTENENLPNCHSFKTVPFKIDMFTGAGAEVGSGTIYSADFSEGVYCYLAEYTDEDSLQQIIGEQFPKAILIDYVDSMTSVTNIMSEYGYINGFTANYQVDQISVSNGKQRSMSCLIGYALDMEGDYEGKNLFVSVGTTIQSSDAFSVCKQVLDTLMTTLRFDNALKDEQDRAARLAEQEAAAEADGYEEEYDEEYSEETIVDDGIYSEEIDASNVTQLPVNIRDNCDVVTVTVTWTNPTDYAVFELFFPGGGSFCDPTLQEATSATFTLKNVEAGTFMLHVKNYLDCGTISVDVNGTSSNSAVSSGQGEAGATSEIPVEEVPFDGSSFGENE